METNKQTDDGLIESIMSNLDNDVSEETTVETEVEAEAEAKVEAKVETEQSEEGDEGESQEEIEKSSPATKNEVNKAEGFKALKKKIHEKDGIIEGLKKKLNGETEEEVKAEAKVKDDEFLIKMAEMLDKDPEEVKTAFKAKDAEKAGMTIEAFDKFNEMNKRMDSYEAEKAEKAKVKSTKDLAEAIDGFIESTGISNEEDVTKFFVRAKEMGFNLLDNPNSKAMVTVFNGMDKADFKDVLEQELLLKIKNGETPMPKSEQQESETVARQKKQTNKFNNNVKRWMQEADDL